MASASGRNNCWSWSRSSVLIVATGPSVRNSSIGPGAVLLGPRVGEPAVGLRQLTAAEERDRLAQGARRVLDLLLERLLGVEVLVARGVGAVVAQVAPERRGVAGRDQAHVA